jgi:non-canonical poly(A) RNA polymerase PAPD5/7
MIAGKYLTVIIIYDKEFPPLKPLLMVLKVFLTQRKLNDTYSGGIGSFVLCSMIVGFLQQRLRNDKLIRKVSWNLGSLLVDFFQYYGNEFNYIHTGISLTEGGNLFSKRKRSTSNWVNQSRYSSFNFNSFLFG